MTGKNLKVFFDPVGAPEVDFDSREMRKVNSSTPQKWRVKFGKFKAARIDESRFALELNIRLTTRINPPPAKPLARIKYNIKVTAPKDLIANGPDYWAGYMLCLAANYAQSRMCDLNLPAKLVAAPFTDEEEDIVSATLDFAKEYDTIFSGAR